MTEWQGYKYIVEDQFKNIKVSQTVDMRDVWEEGHNPDKRQVETKCPTCGYITHPLLVPMTIELEHKRAKYESPYIKRKDDIIYGVECKNCKNRFKFQLICKAWHYPKLGEY